MLLEHVQNNMMNEMNDLKNLMKTMKTNQMHVPWLKLCYNYILYDSYFKHVGV